MTEDPILWYVNRSAGVVALVLLTVSTVLGVLATGGRPAGRLPRFATQALHRNVALLSVVLLVVHVVSAVVDEFVDISWWAAFVPFGSSYQRLWVGLGALAVDLLAVVVLTSLLRSRMRHRAWRVLHLSAYVLWTLSILHGIGMGTDMRGDWWLVTLACAVAAPVAAAYRLARLLTDRGTRPDPGSATTAIHREGR